MESEEPKPVRDILMAVMGNAVEGVRNRSSLPKFLQKPQPRGTEVPITLGNEKDVRKTTDLKWGNVTDSLSNALSEGFGARDDDRDMEMKRMLVDSIYILRGFGLFEVGLGLGSLGRH